MGRPVPGLPRLTALLEPHGLFLRADLAERSSSTAGVPAVLQRCTRGWCTYPGTTYPGTPPGYTYPVHNTGYTSAPGGAEVSPAAVTSCWADLPLEAGDLLRPPGQFGTEF